MHMWVDSQDGQLREMGGNDLKLRSLIRELPPLEQRVISWLYGIGCAGLDAETVASRLNMSEAKVWNIASRAIDALGIAVIMEVAA